MDYHQNARLTIHSRERLAKMVVERGSTLKAAAAAFNVSAKTAAKWTRRYKEPGAGSAQGPQFKAASLPPANILFFIRKGFGPTPAALQRLAHRVRAQAQPGHREPCTAPRRHEPVALARPSACPSPKCSRPSFSSPYDMTRASGTSSLLTVRAL